MAGNGKLTKDIIKELTRLIRSGINNKDACAVAGITEATFYRWLQAPRKGLEVELFESLEKARAERKAFMLSSITSAAKNGTWQAAAWYLERVYPEEFARPDRYHDQGMAEAVNAVRELTESIRAQADAADR